MINFRISEIGHCPKELTLSAVGIKGSVPVWLSNSAEEGNWHEKRIKDQMRKAGYTIKENEVCPVCLERFSEERRGIHVEFESTNGNEAEQYRIIGHLDGQASHPEFTQGKMLGLEVKSMSQYEYDRWYRESWNGFSNYAWQVSTYMHLLNSPFIYVIKNRNIGSKIQFIIDSPIIKWEVIDFKLKELAGWITMNGNKPYPAEFNGDSLECRRCKFNSMCVPEPKLLEPVQKEILDEAVVNWLAGKKMEEDAEILVSKAEEVFITHCKVTTENKWRYGGLSISYNPEPKPRVSYTKENLLKIVSQEQLDGIANVSPVKPSIRITNISKKE
jgi:hypothetical protein